MISLFILCFSINAQDNKFYLNGTVSEGYDNQHIMLFTFAGNSIHSVDTTIIKNGQFSFSGREYISDQSIITTGNFPEKVISNYVILERGNITINLSASAPSYANGTYLNDMMKSYHDTISYIGNKHDKVEIDLSEGKINGEEANEQKWEIVKERLALCADFKRNNIGNIVGKTIFLQRLNEAGMDPYFEEIYSMIDDEIKSDPNVVRAVKDREDKKILNELRKKLQGQEYTNFDFETPDNKIVPLSDFVGKADILIIDFWASWCGPCIAEIPNLKKNYEKYKNNLSIVSISIDNNKNAWMSALKKLDMPWTQLRAIPEDVELLKEKYLFSGIPYIIFLNKNGKITQLNLRGVLLDKFLEISL